MTHTIQGESRNQFAKFARRLYVNAAAAAEGWKTSRAYPLYTRAEG